ncbi:MAG: hypothetical protein MUF49_24645 [Oculatellaceae cyanobacterium Prado106]|jgi:hypothetical protein|nr:hypothetical protein [Oculatellaceae cyanobacterium Prado106]
MIKPDFQAMSQKELHRYVLDHRDDQDAFHTFVDKLHEEGNWVEMPAVESEEELEQYPDFMARLRKGTEQPDA